jgi:hypothetical protein
MALGWPQGVSKMLRILAFALTLILSPLPLLAAESASGALMRQIGFDVLFRDFGSTLALSPRQHGVGDERFLAAWEKCTSTAFAGDELNQRLQQGLNASLSDDEMASVGSFLASPLGLRLAGLERATREIAPERQIETLAKGKTLYFVLPETRRARFEEVMTLSGADVTFTMLGESLRGMAMGLHLSAKGDIALSWDEIDAEVQGKLAGLRESLVDATRSTLAFTYAELTDEELESYLEFLRAPATRKFYAAVTAAIGRIIEETMFDIGQDVAARLSAVSV